PLDGLLNQLVLVLVSFLEVSARDLFEALAVLLCQRSLPAILDGLSKVANDCGAARKGFETPSRPAVTSRPPGKDDHVTDLAGVLAEAVVQLALDYYSSANAGADEHPEDMTRSPRSPLFKLTIGSGIDVVVHKDRASEPLGEPRTQWEMIKVQVRRFDDYTGPPVQRPRRAYSHGV